LPQELVQAKTVKSFKILLDKYWEFGNFVITLILSQKGVAMILLTDCDICCFFLDFFLCFFRLSSLS